MDPNGNTIDLKKLEDTDNIKVSKEGIVQLPKELNDAPDEVKEYYIKWIEADITNKNHPRRYFQFMNTVTKADEQVDCMGIATQAARLAKAKNISNSDLQRLNDACALMESLKTIKSKYKMRWMSYVKPRMGRTVFDWKKGDIIDMYSHYMTHEEIKRELEKLGYIVQLNHVMKFFLNNKDTIDKKRTEFLRGSKDHYLATDAGRMETLAMLHTKFIGIFNTLYSNNSTAAQRAELKAVSQEIRAIIEQARKEIKGDEIKLTIDGKIDINASMQASLSIQELSKKMPIQIIPVYLVAAKRGINPDHIIASLVNSYYKDFNGFGKLNPDQQVKNTLDIIRNYDWNEIAEYHKNKPAVHEATIVEYEEIPFNQVAKIQSKRELLKNLIKTSIDEGKEDLT